MTPSRQSLEEYLKSCSDNEYAEYIISTMHGSCPSEWDKAIKEAIEAIRSRQHTTAPAPIRSMREDEDGHISWQRMNEKALEEHDAQVAKAEREEVLDAIQDHNDGRLGGMDILFATPAKERTESAQDVYLKEAYFELTLVKHLIESLRQPEPQQ